MIYQQGLEKKQRLLARFVNIGTDLFAITATCSRAALLVSKNPDDKSPLELADHFCRDASARVRKQFRSLFMNNDAFAYGVSRTVLDGKCAWLEDDIIPP